MKRIYLLLFASLIIGSPCHANKIDSLNSFRDVFTFIKATFPQQAIDTSSDTSDYAFDLTDQRIVDSLKINVKNNGYWLKTDLNSDGRTDLILLRMKGLPSFFVVLAEEQGYTEHSSSWFGSVHDLFEKYLPVVKSIRGENVIVIYSYTIHPGWGGYFSFRCDTVLLKNNSLLSYQLNPQKYIIEKIKLDDNGSCEGDCPKISVIIDAIAKKGSYSVKYRSPPYKSFEGLLDAKKINSVLAIAQYTNMPDLTKFRGDVYATDMTTATWTINYDGGKEKIIEDYGHYGNAMLSLLYDELVGSLPRGNK